MHRDAIVFLWRAFADSGLLYRLFLQAYQK